MIPRRAAAEVARRERPSTAFSGTIKTISAGTTNEAIPFPWRPERAVSEEKRYNRVPLPYDDENRQTIIYPTGENQKRSKRVYIYERRDEVRRERLRNANRAVIYS